VVRFFTDLVLATALCMFLTGILVGIIALVLLALLAESKTFL
jgi:hypothetical protein